jgi:predicted metalloprotease with PDZ domain
MVSRFSRLSLSAATLLIQLLFSIAASAQQDVPLASINYRLAMSRPASHLFEVSVETELAEGQTLQHLDFQMPRWSPGRYAVFNFAKNVQEVQALSGICPPGAQCQRTMLPVTRLDDQTWRIHLLNSRRLTLSYKVFGDDLSGTFSQLDDRHANFNGGSVFMYIVGRKQEPVKLSIEPPPSWRVVNGYTTRANQREWRFASYDILIDTPTEIAPDWTMDEFKVDGKTYRVVVHSFGDEGGRRSQLVRDIEKIVRAETRMWGVPDFDSYTFLIHFANDNRSSDGMEHLTSTNMIEPGKLADAETYNATLELAAHEFFHVWNVKRLRPAELGPWDFTRPMSTRSLWIAEGVTQYYGELMLRRAGLWTDAQLLERFGETINGIETSPGSRLMSAEESSLVAPFLDGAPDAQRTNLNNTTVNYYYKGEVLAIVLDLLIRGRTRGRASLDDVLRRLYEEFYLKSSNATHYLSARGFTSEDFERVSSAVAGTEMSDFFKRYVRGTEVPPYDEAFRSVGLRLVRAPSRKPSIGIHAEAENRRIQIKNVRNGSPAEDAGLKGGDIILAIGSTSITPANYEAATSRFKPSERTPITINRDGQILKRFITPGASDSFTYSLEEIPDASPEQRQLRAAWMNGEQPLNGD